MAGWVAYAGLGYLDRCAVAPDYPIKVGVSGVRRVHFMGFGVTRDEMRAVCASRLLPNSFLMRALAGLAAGVSGWGLQSWFDSFGAGARRRKREPADCLGPREGELVDVLCRQHPIVSCGRATSTHPNPESTYFTPGLLDQANPRQQRCFPLLIDAILTLRVGKLAHGSC